MNRNLIKKGSKQRSWEKNYKDLELLLLQVVLIHRGQQMIKKILNTKDITLKTTIVILNNLKELKVI
jgi:hypothetical protein